MIADAFCDARKKTISATSLIVGNLFNALWFAIKLSKKTLKSSCPGDDFSCKAFKRPSVLISTGQIALTLIFL